jgi:hypothetical protein
MEEEKAYTVTFSFSVSATDVAGAAWYAWQTLVRGVQSRNMGLYPASMPLQVEDEAGRVSHVTVDQHGEIIKREEH